MYVLTFFGVVLNVCMLFCLLIACLGVGSLQLFFGDIFGTSRETYNMYMCACFHILSVRLITDEKAEVCIK